MLNSRVIAAVFLSAIVVSTVEAGVTIHYEGKAKSRAAATQALQVARAEARRLNWVVEDANASSAQLTRVIAEKERLYTGRVVGIVIRPGPMCDPFYIQFGDDLFLQDFVKTQFADQRSSRRKSPRANASQNARWSHHRSDPIGFVTRPSRVGIFAVFDPAGKRMW
jgi:hypothetical protein